MLFSILMIFSCGQLQGVVTSNSSRSSVNTSSPRYVVTSNIRSSVNTSSPRNGATSNSSISSGFERAPEGGYRPFGLDELEYKNKFN